MTTTRPSGVEVARSIIESSAALLLKCASYLEDRDQAARDDARHKETYYAVDADVITLYLEPNRQVQYADIFGRAGDAATSTALAFLLGDFLFRSSEPFVARHRQLCRFLLVPPHDEELLNILSAIHRKLAFIPSEVDTERFEALSQTFENYQRDGDKRALLAALGTLVPELAELYNPYHGPKAALDRFASLPETALQRLDVYAQDGFAFPLLDPMNNREERRVAEPVIQRWEKLLEQHRQREQQPTEAVRRDAEVLAAIEFANSHLRRDGKRLVLVTGSRYVFDAAETYVPWPQERRSFAQLYLRHPQCFLAHPRFFARTDQEKAQFTLIEWLSLFFPAEMVPAIARQGVVDRRALREIVNGRNRSAAKAVRMMPGGSDRTQAMVVEWETQIQAVAKERYAGGLESAARRGVERLANRLTELRSENRWSIEELRTLVSSEVLQSISELYANTVWVGLWSKAAREESKGVPALRFDDTYRAIEPYLEKVIRLQLKGAVTRDDLAALLALNQALEKADESLYHAHVIHALAFAVKGHNNATRTLARTAMAICDSLPKASRGYLRGREAAYLACIAARRSAKRRQDLALADDYLAQAVERENPGTTVEDVRFKSERLAIATRGVYFDYFCDGRTDESGIREIVGALTAVIGEAGGEGSDRVRHWVLRQTLTNYFTLVLILKRVAGEERLPQQGERLANLERLVTVLGDTEYGRKPEDDPYAHLICDISRANWEPSRGNRERAKRSARAACALMRERRTEQVLYQKARIVFLEASIPEDASTVGSGLSVPRT